MSDLSTALGVRLYPDLVERGGLAAALAECAALHKLDVGRLIAPENGRSRFTHAEMTGDRGVVRVRLGGEARYFMVDISGDGGVRAHGDTCDLLPIVQLVDAWRSGVGLTELAARFPFLTCQKG